MAQDLQRGDLVVAVVGAGTMGRGIAQVCAQAGMTALLFDSRPGAASEALAAIDKALDGQVAKGRMAADAKQGVMARLRPVAALDEVARAGLVIEAIVEDLAIKRELFRELESRIAPDAVIATNTSSLSVTEIAAGCRDPARVGGLHFFNPPPLMRLVEVIGGLRSDPALVEALTGFVRRIGKHPVVAADTPGFVVNHAGRAYGPEALRIVAQGIASPREVDLLMKEAAGFRMGPFELLDLIGADVTHAVMESIYERYYGEPMYQPSAQLAVRVAGGLLGRKTKQGFYNYDGPPVASAPTVPVAPQPKPASAWVADEDGGQRIGRIARQRRHQMPSRRHTGCARLVLRDAIRRGRHRRQRPAQARPGAHGRGRHAGRLQGPPHADENAAHGSRRHWAPRSRHCRPPMRRSP